MRGYRKTCHTLHKPHQRPGPPRAVVPVMLSRVEAGGPILVQETSNLCLSPNNSDHCSHLLKAHSVPGTVLRTSLVFHVNSFNPITPRLVLVLVPVDPEETEAQDQMHLARLTDLALLELPHRKELTVSDRHCTTWGIRR